MCALAQPAVNAPSPASKLLCFRPVGALTRISISLVRFTAISDRFTRESKFERFQLDHGEPEQAWPDGR